jgi:hypothetical protein
MTTKSKKVTKKVTTKVNTTNIAKVVINKFNAFKAFSQRNALQTVKHFIAIGKPLNQLGMKKAEMIKWYEENNIPFAYHQGNKYQNIARGEKELVDYITKYEISGASANDAAVLSSKLQDKERIQSVLDNTEVGASMRDVVHNINAEIALKKKGKDPKKATKKDKATADTLKRTSKGLPSPNKLENYQGIFMDIAVVVTAKSTEFGQEGIDDIIANAKEMIAILEAIEVVEVEVEELAKA